MANIQDNIETVKDNLPNITPTPPKFKPISSVYDLKARLEWGEPALTIIDARDREAFNYERITGAMSMPMERLVEVASGSIDRDRDIYVYGSDDGQTAMAAERLREVGFAKVAQLQGGLAAWKDIAAPTEGIASTEGPSGPSAVKREDVNVAARLANHAETQARQS